MPIKSERPKDAKGRLRPLGSPTDRQFYKMLAHFGKIAYRGGHAKASTDCFAIDFFT